MSCSKNWVAVAAALSIKPKRNRSAGWWPSNWHANVAADELKRFHIDAEAASRLKHPNIVSIYRVGAVEGLPYFTMEFANAGSLASRIAGRVVPARVAAELLE